MASNKHGGICHLCEKKFKRRLTVLYRETVWMVCKTCKRTLRLFATIGPAGILKGFTKEMNKFARSVHKAAESMKEFLNKSNACIPDPDL